MDIYRHGNCYEVIIGRIVIGISRWLTWPMLWIGRVQTRRARR